jgi:predicted Fe-Mo cluster-binding NifX family protein
MRLAIPEWDGQVSPVFDAAQRLLVLDIEHGRVVRREVETLTGRTPEGRARRLRVLGVHVLVCGAISTSVEREATDAGIRVISSITGPVEDVARIVAREEPLPEVYLMPGCHRTAIQEDRQHR